MSRIIRTERRKRGPIGFALKWLFVLYNLLMAWWLIAGMLGVSRLQHQAVTDAERAGAAIGTTLGLAMVVFFWAGGSIILGALALLTRGKKVIVEETQA